MIYAILLVNCLFSSERHISNSDPVTEVETSQDTAAEKRSRLIDIAKLRHPQVKNKFILELRNYFEVPKNTSEDDDNEVCTKWNNIKTIYNETAGKIIGYRNKKGKITERRHLRQKLLNIKSGRPRKTYTDKDEEASQERIVKEDMASEAEQSEILSEMGIMYKITRQLGRSDTTSVQDREGKILTTEKKRVDRWIHYIQEVLNRTEPDYTANPAPSDDDSVIDFTHPNENEVNTKPFVSSRYMQRG